MTAATIVMGRSVSLAALDYGLSPLHANGPIIGICGVLIRTDAGERILPLAGETGAFVIIFYAPVRSPNQRNAPEVYG